MSERAVPESAVVEIMKAVEEETFKRAAMIAKRYGDSRNRAGAAGNDKQRGQVSAAYMIANEIERMIRRA